MLREAGWRADDRSQEEDTDVYGHFTVKLVDNVLH